MARIDRVSELKKTVDEYVAAEKKRIENEVASLEAVLKGRTGGAGVQLEALKVAQSAAANDLAAFLRG
jgi:hypothetical protein